MWSVKENYKETVFALPNVEFHASELTSSKIEALVDTYPTLIQFFEKWEDAEIVEVKEETKKAPVKKKK